MRPAVNNIIPGTARNDYLISQNAFRASTAANTFYVFNNKCDLLNILKR